MSNRFYWVILFASVLLGVRASAQARPPKVFWVSDPVRPGQTVVVFGDSLASYRGLTMQAPGGKAYAAKPYQTSDVCLKIPIPPTLPPGIFQVKIATPEGETAVWVNRPTILWLQGDQGTAASPGGFVRLLGRCLAVEGGQAGVRLKGPDGVIALTPRKVDQFDVQVDLPASLPIGDYQVTATAGPGGEQGWSESAQLRVVAPRAEPKRVFNVRQYGAKGDGATDDTQAVQSALVAAGENAGGGVVLMPRGRYLLSAGLAIPAGVTLRGESEGLTMLGWKDSDTPPEALVRGAHGFVVSDLEMYAANHVHGVESDLVGSDAGDVHIVRVRMRLNPYRGYTTPDVAAQRLQTQMRYPTGGGDAIRVGGKNVEIAGCDIAGGGLPLWVENCAGAWIHDNVFGIGRRGWYSIGGSEGLVFERNTIYGADLMASGGGVNAGRPGCSENVYYADNVVHDLFGGNCEGMTTDGPGGAYYGAVAKCDGVSMTLGNDPTWGAREWRNAGVFVLAGTGRGQYRQIVSENGRDLQIDRPWDVAPDSSSIVTLAALQRNYLFVRNRMEDVGVALQCYGMSIGHIAWGNSSTRTRGYVDVGKEYGAGVQPSWFCQWLENKVQDGAPYLGSKAQSAHMSPGGLIIGSLGPWPSPSACLNLCTVARRNDLEDDASFDVGTDTAFPYTQDLLLEGNTVRDSDVGFVVRQGVFGALLLGNMTTRCERDYDVREGASRDSVRIIR